MYQPLPLKFKSAKKCVEHFRAKPVKKERK